MDTYNETVTAPETNHEFKPIADLLEKEIAATSAEPDAQVRETVEPETQVQETAEPEKEVIPEAGGEKPLEQGEEGKNDCLADTAELVKQIHEFHGMAEKLDTDALLSNWEAGTRFNTLRNR